MNPYVLLVAVIALVVAFFAGQHQGRQIERAAWETKQSTELAAANKLILDLEEKNRAIEAAAATRVNQISASLERKHANIVAEKDRAIADQRNGIARLRDPGGAEGTCTGNAGEAAAGPAERDGSAGGILSEGFAEFLIGQAALADQITEQLGACQQIIVEDRRVVNDPALP